MALIKIKNIASVCLTGTLALGAAHSHALNIMLVNDDGCNAPGLVTLAGVLEQRGHNVSVYAPAGEQSGQGSRLTLPKGSCSVRFELCDTDLTDTPAIHEGSYCITATSVATESTCTADSVMPVPFISPGQTVSAGPADSAQIGLNQLTGIHPRQGHCRGLCGAG